MGAARSIRTAVTLHAPPRLRVREKGSETRASARPSLGAQAPGGRTGRCPLTSRRKEGRGAPCPEARGPAKEVPVHGPPPSWTWVRALPEQLLLLVEPVETVRSQVENVPEVCCGHSSKTVAWSFLQKQEKHFFRPSSFLTLLGLHVPTCCLSV